jgi:hypothetical protein
LQLCGCRCVGGVAGFRFRLLPLPLLLHLPSGKLPRTGPQALRQPPCPPLVALQAGMQRLPAGIQCLQMRRAAPQDGSFSLQARLQHSALLHSSRDLGREAPLHILALCLHGAQQGLLLVKLCRLSCIPGSRWRKCRSRYAASRCDAAWRVRLLCRLTAIWVGQAGRVFRIGHDQRPPPLRKQPPLLLQLCQMLCCRLYDTRAVRRPLLEGIPLAEGGLQLHSNRLAR